MTGRTEYETREGGLYIANKYPSGLNRKWSEKQVNLECDNCESQNISTDLTGGLLVIACMDCENYWEGTYTKIMKLNDDGEAYFKLQDKTFSTQKSWR